MSDSKQTVAGQMSLLGDSPAKISASQAREKESKQNGRGCGQRCFDSSEMYGQRGQLLKMYQPLDLKGLHWSYKISARSGICVSGIAYPLVVPQSVRLTRETGSGLWHIRWPTVEGKKQIQCKWPTPNASDGRDWASGYGSSLRNPDIVGKEVIGKLNPTWVEWLMGYPTGWTDLSNSAIL